MRKWLGKEIGIEIIRQVDEWLIFLDGVKYEVLFDHWAGLASTTQNIGELQTTGQKI